MIHNNRIKIIINNKNIIINNKNNNSFNMKKIRLDVVGKKNLSSKFTKIYLIAYNGEYSQVWNPLPYKNK